jgi:isorenieratene synthase
VLREHLNVKHDFPAFHAGMHSERPPHATGVPGLYFAGDWVKLPFPAMIMEAACTSAFFAANSIFDGAGLRQEPVLTVPLRGLFS